MLVSKLIEFLPQIHIENWPDVAIFENPHPFVLAP
jgi:hypothetical protein